MKAYRQFWAILLIVVFAGCRNHRITQLENMTGTQLTDPQLVDSEEGMDEMTGDRYFISKYAISPADKSKLIRTGLFLPLEGFEELKRNKIHRFLNDEERYYFKSEYGKNRITYIILADADPSLIFAQAQFSGPHKNFP